MTTETIEKGASAFSSGLSTAWSTSTGIIKWAAVPTVVIIGTGMFVSTAGAATPVAMAASEGLGFYAGLVGKAAGAAAGYAGTGASTAGTGLVTTGTGATTGSAVLTGGSSVVSTGSTTLAVSPGVVPTGTTVTAGAIGGSTTTSSVAPLNAVLPEKIIAPVPGVPSF